MATFSVGRGFFANFASTPIATADGEITVADSTLIRISVDRVPAGFENFIGAFSYTDAGLPLGTVREFRLTSGAELIYRIAQADIDWCPWASCAITVLRTTSPRRASAASSICARFKDNCPDALPHGLRIAIPAYDAVMSRP